MSYQQQSHEFNIIDKKAKEEWGELLGVEIHSNTVRTTHEFYLSHLKVIHDIQIESAARLSNRRGNV